MAAIWHGMVNVMADTTWSSGARVHCSKYNVRRGNQSQLKNMVGRCVRQRCVSRAASLTFARPSRGTREARFARTGCAGVQLLESRKADIQAARTPMKGTNAPVMRAILCSTILLLAAMLSGCVVTPVTYQEPEVSGALYFKDTCGGFGAPEVAYYPYHQIFLSVALVSGYFPAIGLHIPPGVTARLDDDQIRVIGHTTHGDFAIEGILRAQSHASFGNWLQHSEPFLWLPDPYRSPADLGPLLGGGTRSGGYYWYLFAAFPSANATRSLELPPDVIDGVIQLPPITVTGERYPQQSIPFKKRTLDRIMPINC